MPSTATNAALIIIGNEILSGRTVDKNLNYIALELGKIGVRFMEARVIPDIEQTIIDTINELRKKYDYIFTTGGIGPTHDDITAESVAKAFGVKLIEHPEALKIISDYYHGDLNEGRVKMTRMPEGSTLIHNQISTAPGFQKENVYVMAGIPNIMHIMFDNVKAKLQGGDIIISKELKVFTSESKIAPTLTKAQNDNPDVEIGSYPFVDGEVLGVSIVIRGIDKEVLSKVHGQLCKELAAFGQVDY